METKKSKLKKFIGEGLQDYVDQGNEPEEEPLRFRAAKDLDVPEKIGEFTTSGESFRSR